MPSLPSFINKWQWHLGLKKYLLLVQYFRAEPSFTSRHMTEFTGWDFEISYINSHEDVMAEEEKLLV